MRISRSKMALTGRPVEGALLCVLEINESDLINRQNNNGLEKSEKGPVWKGIWKNGFIKRRVKSALKSFQGRAREGAV